MFIHPLAIATQPQSMLYMVCDGHAGFEASNFVAANFVRTLDAFLPSKAPDMSNPKGATLPKIAFGLSIDEAYRQ